MDWNSALKDCETCIGIDPSFVKAYIRKGKVQYFLKQYHKALTTYEAGLKLDPNATELKEGMMQVSRAINAENQSGNVDPRRAQEAMKDPEIQAILADPMVNTTLKNMQTDPASGQRAMQDPVMRGKIEKLIAAGILQVK
jgi:stress-induced-phosphoprotein 1